MVPPPPNPAPFFFLGITKPPRVMERKKAAPKQAEISPTFPPAVRNFSDQVSPKRHPRYAKKQALGNKSWPKNCRQFPRRKGAPCYARGDHPQNNQVVGGQNLPTRPEPRLMGCKRRKIPITAKPHKRVFFLSKTPSKNKTTAGS